LPTMIQRINLIKRIGTFDDFRGGASIPLADVNKISVILGRNTVGKTTLSAIFQSLGTNNPELISARESIPEVTGRHPEVQIGYINKRGQRQSVSFRSGLWEANDLKNRIFVFDQDFIHRNLITGEEVTRENREGFTNFVLGEEGVKLSDKIEEANKNLRLEKQSLATLKPPYANSQKMDEEQTKDFVKMEVKETSVDLQKKKEREDKVLVVLGKAEEFNLLPNFSLIPMDALSSFEKLNKVCSDLLAKDYKSVTDSVKKRVLAHIKEHCRAGEDPTLWLKQGLNMVQSDRCPFCSQSLEPVEELIGNYKRMFDEAFQRYEESTQQGIRDVLNILDEILAYSPIVLVSNLIQICKKYEPYLEDIQGNLDSLEKISIETQEAEEKIREAISAYKQSIVKAINIKKTQPHKATRMLASDKALKALYRLVDDKFKKANAIAEKLSAVADEKKIKLARLNPENIAIMKTQTETELRTLDKKIARLQEGEECEAYDQALQSIGKHSKSIDDDRLKLSAEQSEYLAKYFNELNLLFKRLGSENFELLLNSNNRGDRKTYFLDVSYRGHMIRQDQLSKVFSDSDKRSLALAIFMCKIKNLDQKEKMVIVLDDPVVSFDDNRVDQTVQLVKELSPDFAQIILLTHYKRLIDSLYAQNTDTYYLQIKNTTSGSVIATLDARNFTLSPHEKTFEDIMLLISGDDSVDVRRALRPFMEEHVKILFAKQIMDGKIPDNLALNELIDKLQIAGCYDEDTKRKLHIIRENYNPDYHTEMYDPNPSATRVEASNLVKILYEDLVQ